ncbi:hypothetical protein [Candidatus Laterigemmans baculatus]|uniref:hypothetical protein n=1 Tax=Candidatus Laterigemmans baculatus TaxID=2770505 RepID=UPI0013DC0521|nr:hypothetical protein [Candidatus Laterigemmans baculatus]
MFTDSQLRGFLDEVLPPDQMAEIELRLRDDEELHHRLATIRGQVDAGMHSIGAIWRRHRLSCPDREQLSQYLLGVMDPAAEGYVRFHLERIGCRFCTANLTDLEREREAAKREETSEHRETRRRRYFETSAGYLSRRQAEDRQ